MTRGLILAGGAGTRLRSRVVDRPKPMAPVAGRPFLAYVLDSLIDQNVDDVVIATGYRGDLISDYFGARYACIRLNYSVEKAPLGTGGAVKNALTVLDNEPFILMNGDSLAPFDMPALTAASFLDDAGLVLTVCNQPEVGRFGAVVTDGAFVIDLAEKGRTGPGLINCGIYYVGSECIDFLRQQEDFFSFEETVLTPWVKLQATPYVLSAGPFIDIGVPEDYDRASQVLTSLVGRYRAP